MTDPTGVDVDGARRWLASRADVQGDLEFETIHGGRSNLTFRVTDASGARWVLRRPPLHGVLESAHDMGREARIIHALREAALPVPTVVGYEPDADVIGAPFYVMDHVDGLVLRDGQTAGRLTVDARARASEDLARGLATLHDIDPDEVGLGDLAKREEYVGRQLRRWHGQYAKGKARDLPLIDEVHDRLAADVPPQVGVAIVHGDYRLDNAIVGEDGALRAVLDWELCTLGDAMADVGLLHVYWAEADDPIVPLDDPATVLEGFLTREQVIEAYAEASGRDLGELAYYVAFGRWKLAVILEGVYSRYLAGAYGDEAGPFFEPIGAVVQDLAELAAEAAGEAGR